MRHMYLFRKATSVTISILYLSLSLFSISCAYHCAFKDDLPPSHQYSETHQSAEHTSQDHNHNSSDNHEGNSDHSKVLFCKFVHKVGSSVITVSQIVIASLGFYLHETPLNIAVVNEQIDIIHLSRGPPSA